MMTNLPERRKVDLLIAYYLGIGHKQEAIAEAVGVSKGTVNGRKQLIEEAIKTMSQENAG